ncbi:MAG: portal protein, partial [Fidelibacterota bacterium]
QTKIFFSHINHSNFSTEITPSFSDLGIGTGAIQIDEVEFGKEGTITFQNVPLAELHPETPIKGKIENVWRPQEIEAGHISLTWPGASMPKEVENRATKEPQAKEKILNAMLFNSKDGLYYQLVIHKATKHLMFKQSFKSKRLIIYRWHVTPGENFGRGPILQKMADIRTVNKVKQFILENAAIQMAGMYTGVDDGVFNPHTARIAPGIVLPVASNETRNPSLAALPRAGDLGLSNLVLEDLQNSIKKSLLADPLGEITDPVRTLGEQILRMQETLKDRGASFGRLKTELIEPLVAAVVDILQSRGKMAQITINGREVTIKHASPLAKAEDLETFQNSQLWFQTISSMLPQEVVGGAVKIEELPKFWANLLNVPASLIRTKEERAALAQTLIEQAQQGGIIDGNTANTTNAA